MTFAQLLQDHQHPGESSRAMAQRLGYNPQTWNSWLKGKAQPRNIDEMLEIAARLGVDEVTAIRRIREKPVVAEAPARPEETEEQAAARLGMPPDAIKRFMALDRSDPARVAAAWEALIPVMQSILTAQDGNRG